MQKPGFAGQSFAFATKFYKTAYMSPKRPEVSNGRPLSKVERLLARRRRTNRDLARVIALALITLVLDVWLGRDSPGRPYGLFLAFLYGTYASLFASLLTSRMVVAGQIAEQRDIEQIAIGILGLTEQMENNEVAIVLPAFPMIGSDRGDHDEAVLVREQLAEHLGFAPSPILFKTTGDIGRYSYSRRDVLLAIDIVRIAGAAGLPQPLIVSDIVFSEALRNAPSRGGSVCVVTGQDDPGSSRRVRGAVLVGLWSNVTTCQLSEHDAFPFEMVQPADSSVRHIDLFTANKGHAVHSLPESEDDDSDGTFGFLGRFHLPEFTVTVLGGIRSMGTARMGDLVSRHPKDCEELWAVPEEEDLWAIITCPDKDDRDGGFEIYHHRHGMDVVAAKIESLAEILQDLDLRDQRDGDGTGQAPEVSTPSGSTSGPDRSK